MSHNPPAPPHAPYPPASGPSRPPGSTWANLGHVLHGIHWDWPGWLPAGFVTLLASEPGVGKSLLCLRLAACYLNALPWPDGSPFTARPGRVLWCESEAGHTMNIDRARRLGLDLDHIFTPLKPLHNFKLDNKEHADALIAIGRHDSVRLVVLDSLRGLQSRAASGYTLAESIAWLADFARVAGKPVLLTHHLRKRTARDPDGLPTLDRVRGSAVIAQPARLIWAFDNPDPAQPHHHRLSVIKSNLAPFPEPIGMTIDERGPHFGPAPRPPAPQTELDRAVAFLQDLLAARPLPATLVRLQCELQGLSHMTVRRAGKLLGVTSYRPPGQAIWYWTLPANEGTG